MSTYGTGSTDFSAGDTGDPAAPGALWAKVTAGGVDYYINTAIRAAVATNSVAPSVSGTTGLGDTLTAANGTWTATGGSYGYQWKRDGVEIGGATSQTYVLVLADSAADISCDVTYTNSGGAVTVASSNAITAGNYTAALTDESSNTLTDESSNALLAA